MVKVNVKWNKELYNDVEVLLDQPPIIFKTQIFTLTGVPPERQKIMIKGGLLKDDDWGKSAPKDGVTLMMMGTADPIKVDAPQNAIQFVEDLPEEEQEHLATKHYGAGLHNLGNTCYMNSTVQCLYSVAGLKEALASYKPSVPDPNNRLVTAARELFTDLARGGQPFPPYAFLTTLRERFPQFAQQTNEGVFMQQDAEECYSQIMYTLKEKLKEADGSSIIDKLFGVQLRSELKCEETGESFTETSSAFMLKCNISSEINFLSQGLKLGLVEDREKNSAALGRLALFKGASQLSQLPPYLGVQMMRFFYKADVQQKAKILRKVTFPLDLDIYEFCTPELRAQLDGPREALQAARDKQLEAEKAAKKQKREEADAQDKDRKDKVPGAAAVDASAAPAATPSTEPADVEMREADGGASTSAANKHAGALTGRYQLQGVLTHKGRSADSGHYVAWVKQQDGSWILFDDDKLMPKKDEEVLALAGGGDWHMAYLLMYRAVTA